MDEVYFPLRMKIADLLVIYNLAQRDKRDLNEWIISCIAEKVERMQNEWLEAQRREQKKESDSIEHREEGSKEVKR